MKKKRYITPSGMKELERRADSAGVSYYRMMENAGTTAAAFILEKMMNMHLSGRICVLCGKGNNGGDGYVIARSLSDAGLPVKVIMLCENAGTELAEKELADLIRKGTVPVFSLSGNKEKILDTIFESDVIVDSVFGTGFHGEMPPDIAEILAYAGKCHSLKIAVDIPSGGNGLTGSIANGTLRCRYTITFGEEKIGTAMYPLCEYCGEVYTADIGIPDACCEDLSSLLYRVDDDMLSEYIPVRKRDSHKGNFGRVLEIAGSRTMPGAAALCMKAILRSGAGLSKLASVDSVINSVSASVYECTYLPLEQNEQGAASFGNAQFLLSELEKSDVACLGCGMSVCDDTKKLVRKLVSETKTPLIIDADGLNCLASETELIHRTNAAVTPHPAELARLLDVPTADVVKDRLSAAIRFNSVYETPILIKGTPTFIIGENRSYVSFTGNPGLSRGGSGDVLTGIITGLAAMGIPLTEALACGAYLHGKAADRVAEKRSQTGMLPFDLIEELPYIFRELGR